MSSKYSYKGIAENKARIARMAAQDHMALEAQRNLFLERRAAMRHAIRLLAEAGMVPGNGICSTDAATLTVWLDELQEAQS